VTLRPRPSISKCIADSIACPFAAFKPRHVFVAKVGMLSWLFQKRLIAPCAAVTAVANFLGARNCLAAPTPRFEHASSERWEPAVNAGVKDVACDKCVRSNRSSRARPLAKNRSDLGVVELFSCVMQGKAERNNRKILDVAMAVAAACRGPHETVSTRNIVPRC
jgi:hypothetical protein